MAFLLAVFANCIANNLIVIVHQKENFAIFQETFQYMHTSKIDDLT